MGEKIKFGKELEFEFDLDEGELKKNGKPLPKKLDVNNVKLLERFLKNIGKRIERKDLVKSICSEERLTKQISFLRVALDDKKHEIIETLHGHGYKINSDFVKQPQTKEEKVSSTNSKSEKDIVRFFGSAIEEKSVKMVFAYRKHDGDPSHMKSILSDSEAEESSGKPLLFEDVSSWLPSEDVRGCVYIVNMLSQNVRLTGVKFYNEDYNDNQATNTTISFGLFNKYTADLSKLCNNELFQIKNSRSPKDTNLYTDNIAFDNVVLTPKEREDFAIIARIVTHPFPGKVRVQFVVAGRTATGTSVASRALVEPENWKFLLSLYQPPDRDLERDSFAVIISHDLPEKDKDGQVKVDGGQIDETGKFAKDENGDLLIKWKRHSK